MAEGVRLSGRGSAGGEMLLLGQFSIAFLLKAWYGDKTFALSWHLFLTQVG